MSEGQIDFTESLGIYYRSLALIIIGAALYMIYSIFQQKSTVLRYFFCISQSINIAWQCSIFMRYYDPIPYRIITAMTPLMLLTNFFAVSQILEIYNILDPERITKRLLLIMRSVAFVMAGAMFLGLVLLPASSIINFIIGFVVTGSSIIYDQIQSLYLLYLVYSSKGELKLQLYRPFRLVTGAVLILNFFDYASLGLYYYNVMVLPENVSVFPFLVNIAGVHSIAILMVFFRLKDLTFAGTASPMGSIYSERKSSVVDKSRVVKFK